MSWLTEPESDWDAPDPDEDPPRSRLRLVALLIGAWLAVSVVVLIVLLVAGGRHSNQAVTGPSRTSTSAPSSGATSAAALPTGWKQQAADDQTNCAAHAYGKVAAFFAQTPCTRVHRLLATTSANGRAIVIATNTVTFGSAAQAQSYLALVNADGTGNIADLLREGVRYPGGPTALPTAAFASTQDAAVVRVAEAAYASGPSTSDDPTLQAMARQGV